MELSLFLTIRQLASVFLLMVALLHLGAEPALALLGYPVHTELHCELTALSPGADHSLTKETGHEEHDDCCDSCCFCCCFHVLPEYGEVSSPLGTKLATAVWALPYGPSQNSQPLILPPRL